LNEEFEFPDFEVLFYFSLPTGFWCRIVLAFGVIEFNMWEILLLFIIYELNEKLFSDRFL